MNKRQSKKKEQREKKLLDAWGYPMSYREEKQMERGYHEYIVNAEFRNRSYDSFVSDFGIIPRVCDYYYPNRFRIMTYGREVNRMFVRRRKGLDEHEKTKE